MDFFHYRNNQLYAENVPVAELAQRFGTPLYIYSRATLERHWFAFDNALKSRPHQICYAVKANSNLAILQILAKLGSGFDIVSSGELERILAAGGAPEKIVFSGVGKLEHEIKQALNVGISCFNVESCSELLKLHTIAKQMNKIAPIALRINPNIDAQTHPYIATGLKENKFGITLEEALSLYLEAAKMPHVKITGVACHIGSQLTQIEPFQELAIRIYSFYEQLQAHGIFIEHLDLGGGLGVRYTHEKPPSPTEYANALLAPIKNPNIRLLIEPGRAIAANAGILLTKVHYLKFTNFKNFAVVDAGMNDYIRPALYEAYQEIIPVFPRECEEKLYDIVGPVCETGDFLGKDRKLMIEEQDLLALRSAGAYGFSMSSNYNSRPRAAEVLIDGENIHLIRERESIQDLFKHEYLINIRST